jgi:cystathionine gamma-synthase
MVSFQVRGGLEEAFAVVSKTRVFTRASSLGGTESLIEHRASLESAGSRTPLNLIRLSVGLENGEDLVEDLAQALAAGAIETAASASSLDQHRLVANP